MAAKEVLIQRLAEAEQAYHDLSVTGGVRVLVDQNGERIEYTPTSLARLRAYIAEIKSQLGEDVSLKPPLGFWF